MNPQHCKAVTLRADLHNNTAFRPGKQYATYFTYPIYTKFASLPSRKI